MRPKQVAEEFDSFLAQQGLRMKAIVIGGAALALLDVIDRETRDVDILDPLLHPEIEAAARSFARASRAEVLGALDWVVDQDGNELWPDHVRRTFDDLCGRLGHGVH